jgi:hypothetical protein
VLNFSSKFKASEQPRITLKRRVGYHEEEVSAARSKFVRIKLNDNISEEKEIEEGLGGNETEMEMELEMK